MMSNRSYLLNGISFMLNQCKSRLTDYTDETLDDLFDHVSEFHKNEMIKANTPKVSFEGKTLVEFLSIVSPKRKDIAVEFLSIVSPKRKATKDIAVVVEKPKKAKRVEVIDDWEDHPAKLNVCSIESFHIVNKNDIEFILKVSNTTNGKSTRKAILVRTDIDYIRALRVGDTSQSFLNAFQILDTSNRILINAINRIEWAQGRRNQKLF